MAEKVCSQNGCSNKPHGKGLCHGHYQEARKRGDLPHPHGLMCAVPDCGKYMVRYRSSIPFCYTHYRRSLRRDVVTIESVAEKRVGHKWKRNDGVADCAQDGCGHAVKDGYTHCYEHILESRKTDNPLTKFWPIENRPQCARLACGESVARKTNNLCARCSKRRNLYNLTEEAYLELWTRHDGLCHSCRERIGTDVDHDHSCCADFGSCGKCVRGLLCNSCNRFIGLAMDREELLRRAADYVIGGTPLVYDVSD